MHTPASKPWFSCPLTCDFVLATFPRAFTAIHKYKNPREHWRICGNTFRRNTSKNKIILRCFGTVYSHCREGTTFKLYTPHVHLKHPSLQDLGHPVWFYLYKDSSPRLMSLQLHRYSTSLQTGISAQRKPPLLLLPSHQLPRQPSLASAERFCSATEKIRGEKRKVILLNKTGSQERSHQKQEWGWKAAIPACFQNCSLYTTCIAGGPRISNPPRQGANADIIHSKILN